MFLLAFLTLFIAIANAFPPSKEPIEVRNAVLVVDPRDLSTAEIIVDWRLPKYGSAAAHTRIRTKNTRPGEMPSGVSYLLLVNEKDYVSNSYCTSSYDRGRILFSLLEAKVLPCYIY